MTRFALTDVEIDAMAALTKNPLSMNVSYDSASFYLSRLPALIQDHVAARKHIAELEKKISRYEKADKNLDVLNAYGKLLELPIVCVTWNPDMNNYDMIARVRKLFPRTITADAGSDFINVCHEDPVEVEIILRGNGLDAHRTNMSSPLKLRIIDIKD